MGTLLINPENDTVLSPQGWVQEGVCFVLA